MDSAFEHLALSVGFSSGDEFMAMMTVYFDDSGTDLNSKIAVAACFISDVRRWGKPCFEDNWKRVLNDAGISAQGFHMADFNARTRPFDGWSDQKRQEVPGALIACINKYALYGCIAAVTKDDYDRLVVGKLREKLGRHHYTFAVQACLYHLQEWLVTGNFCQPVDYVFDQMGKGKNEINNLFDNLIAHDAAVNFGIELNGWSFHNRRLVVQLQSADILAWEGNKYMRECQFTGQSPRPSFRSLVEGVSITAKFYDDSCLPQMVAEATAKYETAGWQGPLGGFL